MALGKMLTRKAITAGPSETLGEVVRLMDKKNVGAVVITEENRPVGIVTDRDLALATCLRGMSPKVSIQEIMTCPVTTISQDEGIFTATQQMMDHAVRRLPVVDNAGRLVGLVSLDDLLLLLSRELHNMAEGIKAEVGVA
jgi:CBS domain-containing protein